MARTLPFLSVLIAASLIGCDDLKRPAEPMVTDQSAQSEGQVADDWTDANADATSASQVEKSGDKLDSLDAAPEAEPEPVEEALAMEDEADDHEAVAGEAGRSQVVTKEFLERVPSGRSYQSPVGVVDGVVGGVAASGVDASESANAGAALGVKGQGQTAGGSLDRFDMDEARPARPERVARAAEKTRNRAERERQKNRKAPTTATVAPTPPSSTPAPNPGFIGVPIAQQPVVPESNTEDYTNYGINGFTLTDRDKLSTFAVDVDTASYTITRRKLRDGYLPPQAAVRVEEFVNYFPYEYAQPKQGHPFAVDVEAAPSPYNPQNHIVRVGVQGKKVQFDTRRPVNLTFLVDVSGSMQSRDKMGLVKDTLRMLTKELEDGDTVALVTYAGATKVVLSPTPISQRGRILSALDGLSAGGSTAMGAGIELAYAQAEATYRPGSVNRVIVASDGDANVGVTSHSQLTRFISGKAKKGITLTTLGFGNGNYKDTMMERLANEGDGNYYYIDSIQESRRLFVDQLSSTLEVIAKDVKIQVEWNPDAVLAYRLIGYENRDVADRDFRNDAVDAGEIGAGHQVTALYEVALKDDLDGGLGTVRIRNKAPGPEAPASERKYVLPSSIVGSRFADASAQFRLQSAAAGFAEILRGSPHMNEVSLRDVAAIARAAKRVEYQEDNELIELIDRAARLRGEGAYSRR